MRFAVSTRYRSRAADKFRRGYLLTMDNTPSSLDVSCNGEVVEVEATVLGRGRIWTPWQVEDYGEVFIPLGSLMERSEPYKLLVELARGALNQLRGQWAVWEHDDDGLLASFGPTLKRAYESLAKATVERDLQRSEDHAARALKLAFQLSDEVLKERCRAKIKASQDDKLLDCMIHHAVDGAIPQQVAEFADRVTIPVDWNQLEPEQGQYDWKPLDATLKTCRKQGLPVTVGPLIDFRNPSFPDWLHSWQDDFDLQVTLMCNFVETCLHRYEAKVDEWETTAGINWLKRFSLDESRTIEVIATLLRVAHDVSPDTPLRAGVDQIWGEQLPRHEYRHPASYVADWLARADAPMSSLVLDVAVGYPDGDYPRSLIDFSQTLDIFGSLDVPLHVRLRFPSEPPPTPTDPLHAIGHWRGPADEQLQADWLEKHTLVCLANERVRSVCFGQFQDLPDDDELLCGILDAQGKPKTSYDRLARLRSELLDKGRQ